MSLYPYNPEFGQTIQSKVAGQEYDRGFVAHLALGSPAAQSDTAVLAATTLAVGATTTVTTGITNPAVARALRIKGNQAGIVGNVVITGTDMAGNVITDTIAANGANGVDGVKAFKTVTQIVLPQRVTAGDTISVGFCDKLGLPYKLPTNTVLFAALNGTREGTAPTVTTSATALESNTIDLNSALAGTPVDVYLIV